MVSDRGLSTAASTHRLRWWVLPLILSRRALGLAPTTYLSLEVGREKRVA